MIEPSRRSILLVDHTKFGRVALHRLAPLTDFDLVIVDSGVDKAHLDEMRERSIPFEIAPL